MTYKILVTGGSGLIGRALQEIMPDAFYANSKDADLTNQVQVESLFARNNFDTVIHLAARVGGLQENIKYQANFFDENILMNTNIVGTAHRHGITNFIGMLSTCIFPSVAKEYPLTEEMMFESEPSPSNYGYAIAKRAMETQIRMYNQQYGTKYFCLIPANCYGDYDKYDVERSHYVGALIRKIHDAKISGSDHIILMGTGTPLRQFVYSGDIARIIKNCIDNDIRETMNIASHETYTIDEIAHIALHALDATHLKIKYDKDQPDGQYRKDVSIAKLKILLPDFNFTSLYEGIKKTYKAYLKQQVII